MSTLNAIDKWLDEIESFGLRRERLIADVGLSADQMQKLLPWFDAALTLGIEIAEDREAEFRAGEDL